MTEITTVEERERCQRCGHTPAYHGAGFCACVVGTPPGIKCDCDTFTPFRPDRPVGVSEDELVEFVLSRARDGAEAQREEDLAEGVAPIGTSTPGEVEWYAMGNWAAQVIREFCASRPSGVVDTGQVGAVALRIGQHKARLRHDDEGTPWWGCVCGEMPESLSVELPVWHKHLARAALGLTVDDERSRT
ncbi:MAG: hypothetical protein IMZ55_10305 [Acidobacteria bacterium]|nr:hypothetical protein [Acidobacteriota bacterium]